MEKFIVVDTETTNSIDDPIVYDVGFAVVDAEGTVYEKHSYVVADVFLDKELMSYAYFADKIPQYWADIKSGKRKLCRFKTIRMIFKDVCAQYVYYYMTSNPFQAELRSRASGTTVLGLKQPELLKTKVVLPDYNIQREIAAMLSEIDDKIAVNKKICENLEAQAQALFKHWFVDFAPFKDGKFVESELGLIPEGWRVGKAEDFYTINIGKTPPRAERQWFSESKGNNKIWISISDMGSCGTFISDSKEYLTPEAQRKFNVVMVPAGTILLSFKLTIGRVAIADNELTTNEAIARFILPNSDYREFTYLYLKQYKYERLGSTSSIATAVNSKII